MVDYFEIIHKYIDPTSSTYGIYLPHVTLVAAKSLAAGRKLKLFSDQLQFIEEAAMLHDIGIIRVDEPGLGCVGELPYLCHGVEGRAILEAEGLPRHALVAERHVGVGISRAEILTYDYPLPPRDMLPQTVEEEIISWADLFFSKDLGKLWVEKSPGKIRKRLAKRNKEQVAIFDAWQARFGE